MTTKTDSLREISLDIAGEKELPERQDDTHSKSPIDERDAEIAGDISATIFEDGLDGAVSEVVPISRQVSNVLREQFDVDLAGFG